MLYRGSTAQQTWDRLKTILRDNKHTRAICLEDQFHDLHLTNFANINAYYQQLKTIRNQLAIVDQDVSEQKLVIRLVAGLVNTDFITVALTIQQTEPLDRLRLLGLVSYSKNHSKQTILHQPHPHPHSWLKHTNPVLKTTRIPLQNLLNHGKRAPVVTVAGGLGCDGNRGGDRFGRGNNHRSNNAQQATQQSGNSPI